MKHLFHSTLLGAAVALTAALPAQAAYRFSSDSGQSLLVTGFLREHVAINLQDHPEVDDKGKRIGGKGDLSMLRTTFKLDLKADLGFMQAVAVYRADYEHETSYLSDLQDTVHLGAAGQGAGGNDFTDDIEGDHLREWYVVIEPTDRIRATLGKQQVVWGETDFFRAMDIINGFDLRWRSFLETENEELRKPLIMANVEIDIPEWNGNLQLVYRPGWDRASEVGNSLDISGGRWATHCRGHWCRSRRGVP